MEVHGHIKTLSRNPGPRVNWTYWLREGCASLSWTPWIGEPGMVMIWPHSQPLIWYLSSTPGLSTPVAPAQCSLPAQLYVYLDLMWLAVSCSWMTSYTGSTWPFTLRLTSGVTPHLKSDSLPASVWFTIWSIQTQSPSETSWTLWPPLTCTHSVTHMYAYRFYRYIYYVLGDMRVNSCKIVINAFDLAGLPRW